MLDNGILIGKYTDSMQGIVISGSRNMFAVECADGSIRQCTLKGKKLKDIQGYYNPLAPGDIVEIGTDALNDNQGQIIALIPRKNEFVRWNVKGRALRRKARPPANNQSINMLSCMRWLPRQAALRIASTVA